MTALDIGGVLSIACTFCEVPRGQECRKANGDPTKPHAARLAAAPPIVEAHVGDLVLVRYRGEHVAQLVDIGVVLTVRFWRPSAQVFASPRLLEREAVIGLAPDDARTAIACRTRRRIRVSLLAAPRRRRPRKAGRR